MTRPKRFNYQPGDYIFLKIPAIAKYEWHPLTISSSPEQDFVGFHIRAVGTWTNKLYMFVDASHKKKAEHTESAITDGNMFLTNENAVDVNFEQIGSNGCKNNPDIPVIINQSESNTDEGNNSCKRIEVNDLHAC